MWQLAVLAIAFMLHELSHTAVLAVSIAKTIYITEHLMILLLV